MFLLFMSVWDEYNEKTYIDFIASKYCHLFSKLKKSLLNFKRFFIDSIKRLYKSPT